MFVMCNAARQNTCLRDEFCDTLPLILFLLSVSLLVLTRCRFLTRLDEDFFNTTRVNLKQSSRQNPSNRHVFCRATLNIINPMSC